MFSLELKEELAKVLKKLQIGVSEEEISLEHPAEMEHGDYATNVALVAIKQQSNRATKQQSNRATEQQSNRATKKKISEALVLCSFASPKDLAEKIVKEWQEIGLPDFVEKIEVAGPGFINIWLSLESLGNYLVGLLNKGFTREGFGEVEEVGPSFAEASEGKRKTMVIDYSAPNIAKPFGIGHLRSTNIGQAIYNLYKFLGWKVIGDNHWGDWGTQFGKLIFQIVRHLENHPELAEGSPQRVQSDYLKNLTIADLEKLYVDFHKEAEEHPEMEEGARSLFKKLEDNDPQARMIWKACVDISMKEFDRVYEILGVKMDYVYGESFYQDKMAEILKDCEQKGLLKESLGAKVIEISGETVPAMLVKSDGGTTYLLRDLATVKYRMKTWNPDLIIYEVGADQSFYFRQMFKLCVLLGYGQMKQFVHIAHGLIRWTSGKFSTRKGMTIHLEEVLDEAIKRATAFVPPGETSVSQRKKIAEAVGIGAIKYNDLRQNPRTDVIFDWDQMLTLSGNSGPYLQYTYARTQSVLRKAGLSLRGVRLSLTTKQSHLDGDCFGDKPLAMTEEERLLLRTIYRFPEAVGEAAKIFSPNLLCNFLFDLAQKFNLFYDKHRILPQRTENGGQKTDSRRQNGTEPTENESAFRLGLTAAVGQILKTGLGILGIETPEKM